MKVVVRYYRRTIERIGPVNVEGYYVEREEEKQEELFDIIAELSERYSNTPDVVIEAILTDNRGEEHGALAYTSRRDGQLLFQRPAKLKKIYLIDEMAASSQIPQPLDKLPSYTPSRELYVYVGNVSVENPKAVAILLETDRGTRLLMVRGKGVKKDSNSSKAPG